MFKRATFVFFVSLLVFCFSPSACAWHNSNDTVKGNVQIQNSLQEDWHFVGYRQLKTDLPFGLNDPRMQHTFNEKEYDDSVENEKDYDYWCTEAVFSVGSGEKVNRDPSLGKGVIAHEEFHDFVILPCHMTEAGAEIARIAAESDSRDELIVNLLFYYEACVTPVNNEYEWNLALYDNYHNGKITKEELLEERSSYPVELVCCHSYTVYGSLMFELFIALDYDIKRFKNELNSLLEDSYKKPKDVFDLSFEENRRLEKELEVKIEEIIKRNTSK